MESKENTITGRAIGAKARSDKLTPEQRSDIARKAALARHNANKPIAATHIGNFQKDFNLDIECYVLNDENRTAVIHKRGMAEAIGLSVRGERLLRFISGKNISEFISQELKEKIHNPIIFQMLNKDQETTSRTLHGYDVTILIDLCNSVIRAKAHGVNVTDNVFRSSQIIVSASAKSGIQQLVYKLAGFDSTKEHFIQAFKRFVSDEAKKYEKEFPIELYEEWARLYSLTIPARGWPWDFRHLTVKHVYHPLAKSNGKLLTLLRESKDKDGDRKKKLFQFLNEVGARALRMQLGRLLEMAESSKTRSEYENKIAERFGGQFGLEFGG